MKLDTPKLPPARDEKGRLIAGRQSINPKGRPKKYERPDTTFEQKVDRLLDEASRLPEGMQMERDDPKNNPREDKSERDADGKFTKNGIGRTPAQYGGRISTPAQARKLIGERMGAVINKMCDLAIAGDVAAAKLVTDRFLPALKATSISVNDASSLPMMIIQSNVIDTVLKDEADGIEDAEVVEQGIPDKMPTEPV